MPAYAQRQVRPLYPVWTADSARAATRQHVASSRRDSATSEVKRACTLIASSVVSTGCWVSPESGRVVTEAAPCAMPTQQTAATAISSNLIALAQSDTHGNKKPLLAGWAQVYSGKPKVSLERPTG